MNNSVLPPPSGAVEPGGDPGRAIVRAQRKSLRHRRLTRREACFEALSAGYTHEQIARKFKISARTVRRDVDRAIDERRLHAPERYIHLQVDRLTRALRSADDRIERGDMKAVLPLLRIAGALDRYHGLDARWRRDPLPPLPAAHGAPVALAAPREIPLKLTEKDTQALESA